MARILVVDDQPHVTLCLSLFLTRRNHEVVRANDGNAALELLRSESFDVMITDVDMPGLDGLSLVAHEDEISRLRGVIVLTGRTDYEEITSLESSTTIHVAPKPLSPTRISDLVTKLVEKEAGAVHF